MNAPQNPSATPNADFAAGAAAGEGLLSFDNADNTNASADAENPDASTGSAEYIEDDIKTLDWR